MKKSINQSTLLYILNSITILFVLAIFLLNSWTVVLNNKIDKTNINRVELIMASFKLSNASKQLTSDARVYVETGDANMLKHYNDEVSVHKNREQALEICNEIGLSTEENAIVQEMQNLSSSTLATIESNAFALVATGNLDAAAALLYSDDYLNGVAKVSELNSTFSDSIDLRTSDDISAIDTKIGVATAFLFATTMISILIQFILIYISKRKIIIPIRVIEKQMLEISNGNLSQEFALTPDTSEIGMLTNGIIHLKEQLSTYIDDISKTLSLMADGNMDQQVTIDYEGDFEPIKTSLNKILSSLNSTLSQIDRSSSQVNVGSQQVSNAAQTLSQGAAEQASSIMTLSSSAEEIAVQIKQNAQAALTAKSVTESAAVAIKDNNEQMKDMIAAMNDISNNSHEISKIIKTIDDIAFQTNILALNAAVEAARAGEAGKGFAVVADEVRNLAVKSAEAAKHTSNLISETVSSVQKGSSLANVTANAMLPLIDGALYATSLITEISKVSEYQSELVDRFTVGMDQISDVVTSNSATAEESAASSEELSNQSELLKTLVSRFHLKDNSLDFNSLTTENYSNIDAFDINSAIKY